LVATRSLYMINTLPTVMLCMPVSTDSAERNV
jgi:hypothetical protein